MSERFRKAGAGELIDAAYGYDVFPTIGKGGIGIGGAHSSGRVYKGKSKLMGETKMTQVISGLQLGGQAFSQLTLSKMKDLSMSLPMVILNSALRLRQ